MKRAMSKDATIFSKVTDDVRFIIKQVAHSLGLTESEYIRFVVLLDLQQRGALEPKLSADFLRKLEVPAV
jgi:hypothetical protein